MTTPAWTPATTSVNLRRQEYHRRPDEVRGRAIEGCGHFVPEDGAEELIGELRTFLSGA